MARVQLRENSLFFICPGCALTDKAWPEGSPLRGLQRLAVGPTGFPEPVWSFNGSQDSPTLQPSILSHLSNGHRCHSFITDGQIRFLEDCTHPLKGQTVPLPECPEEF